MVGKLRRDELLAQRNAIQRMVDELPTSAQLTALSLKSRLVALDGEIASIDAAPDALGHAALMFGGRLVDGSRAIDAEFAVRSLKAFQDLISKKVTVSRRGPLGAKGPVPEKDAARLNITGTVRGSFGFILEEDGQPGFFPSAVKDAMTSVIGTLGAFADEDDASFAKAVEEVDPRLFSSVRDFFKSLHDADGTVRIVEGELDRSFGRLAVERAFERVEMTSIEDLEQTVYGRLIGVLPVSRTFEFIREDTGRTVKGGVGPQLGGAVLERIERDELPLGKRWEARFSIRTVTRPRASPREQITLIALAEAPGVGAAEA
jgi:hypothetical protein